MAGACVGAYEVGYYRGVSQERLMMAGYRTLSKLPQSRNAASDLADDKGTGIAPDLHRIWSQVHLFGVGMS